MELHTDNNQWLLFGHDVRTWGRLWVAAWRDLLFSPVSPLRRRFDEPVLLRDGEEAFVVQGDERVDGFDAAQVSYEVLGLPEELYLSRTVTLPTAVESDLDGVLSMEVASNSPFPADDTASGWREIYRDEQTLTLAYAVASRSAVLHWLGQTHPQRSLDSTEFWVRHDQHWLALQGFGEGQRERLYKRRLLRLGALTASIVALVFVAVGLFVLQQRAALQQLEAAQARVMAQASEVTQQREQLLIANQGIAAAGALQAELPNPHIELARLTELLGDEAYVAHFSMRGRDLRVRGRATDAASVMQFLSNQPEFASVTAPQAITAVGNTGVEQFHLDIRLADGSEGGLGESGP